MFITPYFGGCKYTNKFLFINKNIEFQWLGLLITTEISATPLSCHVRLQGQTLGRSRVRPFWKPTRSFESVFVRDGARNATKTPESGTITQNFRQKVAWRYQEHGSGGRKRDRHAVLRTFLCVTVPGMMCPQKVGRIYNWFWYCSLNCTGLIFSRVLIRYRL